MTNLGIEQNPYDMYKQTS